MPNQMTAKKLEELLHMAFIDPRGDSEFAVRATIALQRLGVEPPIDEVLKVFERFSRRTAKEKGWEDE